MDCLASVNGIPLQGMTFKVHYHALVLATKAGTALPSALSLKVQAGLEVLPNCIKLLDLLYTEINPLNHSFAKKKPIHLLTRAQDAMDAIQKEPFPKTLAFNKSSAVVATAPEPTSGTCLFPTPTLAPSTRPFFPRLTFTSVLLVSCVRPFLRLRKYT